MTQEIIVYRNPLEKAMWDTMSGGGFFAILMSAVAFVVMFVLVSKGLERIVPWKHIKAWWVGVVLWGIPAIVTIFTFNHFNI